MGVTEAPAPPAPEEVVNQIEALLEQLRTAASAPAQTNRQKRSAETDKFARVKGDALLKVLNKIVRELQKIRQAVLSSRSARKGRKLGKSSNNKKNKKGKGKNKKNKSKRKGRKLNNKNNKKKPKKSKKKKSKNRG